MTWPLCFGCHVTYAKKTSFPNSKILRLDEPAKPAPECSDFVFQGRRDTCISAVLASPKIGCDYRGRGAIGEKMEGAVSNLRQFSSEGVTAALTASPSWRSLEQLLSKH